MCSFECHQQLGCSELLKMKASIALLTLIVICTAKKGLALVTFVDPTSGSLIAHFEGTENASTLTCNVNNSEGFMTATAWFVQNFRGSSGLQAINDDFVTEIFSVGGDTRPNDRNRTFRNQLTFVNFTAELDGVTIYCGTGSSRQEANFSLRVYRPPMIRDNVLLKVRENSGRIPVNLSEGLPAFPEPTFLWTKDGETLNGPILTYNSVTFNSVRRPDGGNYTVMVTNFLLNTTTPKQVGNDTGSFYLDVLFGPILTPGPLRRYVLLNDSLSLVCGTGLESNPQATITWTAPDGTMIMDNDRYDLENGPQFVRLNFTHTIPSDNGVWRCEIVVESEQDVIVDGQLTRTDSSPIGQTMVSIELVVIAPPGPPRTLIVDSSDATSLLVCWEAPLDSDSPISFYTISARNLNNTSGMDDIVIRNTTNNSTLFNVTGLLPGTTYELTVVAVSRGGSVFIVSQPSEPMSGTTNTTVPALRCNPPVSFNGTITVSWSYIHTGGLDITGLSVSYTFEEGSTTSNPVDVSVPNIGVTNVSVMVGLIAGNDYTFTVTASNTNGPTNIQCGPTPHDVGVPAQPAFGNVRTGDNAGEVVLEVKTVASGVDSPSQQFRFIIIPVLADGVEGQRTEHSVPDYQSGTVESIVVGDLMLGQSYSFSATAVNIFGNSTTANSAQVTAAGARPPTPTPTQGSGVGAVVGGAVGGIAAVIIVVAVVVIIVVVLLVFCRGRESDYRPKKAEAVRYEKAPTSDNGTKLQEVAVDIGEDMGNKPKEDTEIQYAELDTFRPPSQQKNKSADKEPKPVEIEEPVEYAIITNFKKKEDDPAPVITSAVPDPAPDASEGDADKTGTSTTLV